MKIQMLFGAPRIFFLSLYLLIGLFLLAPGRGLATEAYMLDVVRGDSAGERLLLSARLDGAFSKDIIAAIESGSPVTFIYSFSVERIRTLLWDQTVSTLVLKRMIRYDRLRNEYLVWEKKGEDAEAITFDDELRAAGYVDEEKREPSAADDSTRSSLRPTARLRIFTEAREWMMLLQNIDLGAVDDLEQGSVYRLSARCRMNPVELSPPFNYLLFFVTLWDFETERSYSAPFMINRHPAGWGSAEVLR